MHDDAFRIEITQSIDNVITTRMPSQIVDKKREDESLNNWRRAISSCRAA